MVRLVIRWLDSPWAFELKPGLNKLGRNPTNDFRVSDPSVSSFHAELTVENELIRVRDLGSTNGTFIDEQKIAEWVLKPENTLRLGNVKMKLDEVVVMPVAQNAPATPQQTVAEVVLAPNCAYHKDVRASFRCENCGETFCTSCVTVVGQNRTGTTTVCPLCKGQCYDVPAEHKSTAPKSPSLLNRLTQTLKIQLKK
jgi:pSer/pThr/pTyr-binding forkhead associated (FHA) protein